jgi:rhodanese-related sulfurtransferase
VPGAVNLGLGGQFAPWAGALLPVGAPIVLVAEEEAALREATLRLARVGHESVVGHLAGGMGAWAHDGLAADQLEQVTVQDLAERMGRDKGVQVLDVRRPGEHEGGHVPGAKSFPLDGFAAATPALDPTRPTYVICASGYRSVAALSLLRRRGFTHVVNVVGGTSAWVAAGYPVERAAALTAAPPTSSSTTPRA